MEHPNKGQVHVYQVGVLPLSWSFDLLPLFFLSSWRCPTSANPASMLILFQACTASCPHAALSTALLLQGASRTALAKIVLCTLAST